MENVSLNFHETFKPENQYISVILEMIDEIQGKTSPEISYITGIPTGKSSGKVKPHLYYAKMMGLIDFKKLDAKSPILLTNLGRVVTQEDLGMYEDLTILLCHCMMLRRKGARLWSFIFREIFPKYNGSISFDLLLKELEEPFGGKVTRKGLAPFIGTYTDFAAQLSLLEVNKDLITVSPMRINPEFIFLYGYILLEYWDEIFADRDEITSDELKDLHFRDAFCWNDIQEYECLEQLSEKGVIRLNRQLSPFTILRVQKKKDIVDKLYSELL